MQRLAEQIVGPRLVLRRWTVDDAAVLDGLIRRNLDHLRARMTWIAAEPQSRAERIELLASWDRSWQAGLDTVYGMHLDGVPVGSCGLHDRVGPDGLEIGYWVDADHQGHGFAGEASALLTTAAFALDRIERVVILHDETNLRSRRVPERLGYRCTGAIASAHEQAPEDTGVDLVWEVSRAAWAAGGGLAGGQPAPG
ncbi:MAG: GNAT family N-acetyltransferase [Acidimicrobiales bacterium]